MHDFVVIGGGVSGMASALLLAQAGRKVALVEAAPRTAPLLRGFVRHGVRFDTGFHYTGGLAPGEPLDRCFRHLGLSGALSTYPFREEGFDLFRCEADGFEFDVPAGGEALRDRLCGAFPAESAAIGRYLAMVRESCDAMPYMNLDVLDGSGFAFRRVFGPTLRETLDGLTGDERLKAVLSMHCMLHGVSPREIPFVQHAAVVGNYYRSARGIAGGGDALARAFDARLGQAGVDVRCGSGAAALSVDSAGRLSGVELDDGSRLPCTGCVATLHPQLLSPLLPEGAVRPAWRKRIGALEETVSAFILHAASEGPLPALLGRNRFAFPRLDGLDDLGTRPVGESPVYVTAAFRPGDEAPHGFIAIVPADGRSTSAWADSKPGGRPEGYRRFKASLDGLLRARVAAAFPDLAGAMAHTVTATPLTLAGYCRTPHGSLYGVKHRVGQHNPDPATRLPGLFLAGQATAAPGVLGAVLSGYLACGAILGHDRLAKELKACA
jgi:all-trans-retinol 13,14-reductase